jgi:transcriptional regulator with XRE-family HTH domain
MNIGSRLKELRNIRGISLRNLAKKVGVSASFISQVEQDKCQPSLETLRKISHALDVPASYILEAEHNEVSPSREVAEIRLPNRLRYLSVLAEFVGGVCRGHEVPGDALEDILLAVDEASSNIIKYAYEVGSTNYFRVRISCDRKLLQVDLLDQGKKFNPLEAPPLDGKDITAAGKGKDLSLGIHIMKKVMDDVRYQYSPSQGNHLILVKKIPQSKRSSL